MQNSNANYFRAWLRQCPAIGKKKYFGADYMGEKATQYAIMTVPSTLQYRENIIGERVLQPIQEQNFIFAATVPYGSDVRGNLSNLAFFQEVADWIREQDEAGNFPEWTNGIVKHVTVSNTGAPVQTGSDVARYQFQIRVTYRIRPEKESEEHGD